MPNWAAGNIRFRGKLSDILKCLEENLVYCQYATPEEQKELKLDTIQKPAKVECEDEYIISVSSPFEKNPESSWCYINTTHRNFLNMIGGSNFSSTGMYKKENDPEHTIVVFDDFRGAWSVDADPYIEMSKKYSIDIAIFVWEQGVGFSQKIFVENGELKIDKTYAPGLYEEWYWNSEMPYLGG